MTVRDVRSDYYRALRLRGHLATACLRAAYGRGTCHSTPDGRALEPLRADIGRALHEATCPGCRTCVTDWLHYVTVDQTIGVAVAKDEETADREGHVLFVVWSGKYAHLLDDGRDPKAFAAGVLLSEGWRPVDGPAAAMIAFERFERRTKFNACVHIKDHVRRIALSYVAATQRRTDKFVAHLEAATAKVSKWPTWKRQVLGGPIACACYACDPPQGVFLARMYLCETCGNKRCPHATDHRNACTNSNAPGQNGSAYE